MTSNGVALGRLLPRLRAAGLDALNVSLDTLDPRKFELITRRRGWELVRASLDAAVAAGFSMVKVCVCGARARVHCRMLSVLGRSCQVNVVVMRGVNDDEAADFVRLSTVLPIDVRFIEYMPFDGTYCRFWYTHTARG
jgi:molybdenum cofactor biosynthesis enzyme MoaA